MFDSGPVREQPDFSEHHAATRPHAAQHCIGVDRLYADDFDVRTQLFGVGCDPTDETPASDRDKDGIDGARVLAQDLHADGPLACNHIRIVKGVHEGQLMFFF